MLRLTALFILLCLSSTFALAQTHALNAVYSLPGNGFFPDILMDVNSTGDVWLAGGLGADVDVQPGPDTTIVPYPYGADQSFLARYDTAGTVQWAGYLNNNNNAYIYGIAVDANDNLYVTGIIDQPTDFDLGPDTLLVTPAVSQFQNSGFLAKYNGNGEVQWAMSLELLTFYAAIELSNQGQVVLASRFTNTIDLDPGPAVQTATATGLSNMAVVTFDTAGSFVSAFHFGDGDGGVYLPNLAISPAGDVILASDFALTIDFDPGADSTQLTALNGSDSWIASYSTSGTLNWVRPFPSTHDSGVRGLSIDASGNIFVSGYYSDTLQFDAGLPVATSAYHSDENHYLAKLNPSGVPEWGFGIGSLYNGALESRVVADAAGNVVLAGYDINPIDLDPGPAQYVVIDGATSSSSNPQLFFAYYSGSGAFLSGCAFDDPNNEYDRLTTIKADAGSNIYLCGHAYEAIDWDCGPDSTFNETTPSQETPYWVKFGSCPVATDTVQVCAGSSYTFPDGTTEVIDQTMHHFSRFATTNDCDSIIRTTIIALTQYSSSANDTVCAGSSYTFPDGSMLNNAIASLTDTSHFVTSTGCDSVVFTHLQVQAVGTDIVQNGAAIVALQDNAQYQWLDCNNGFQPLPNATFQTYFPLGNGSYAAAITINNCTDTTDCINLTGLLARNAQQQAVRLFPNPSTGTIGFSAPLADVRTVEVFNLVGARVATLPADGTVSTLQLPQLASGSYMLRVVDAANPHGRIWRIAVK